MSFMESYKRLERLCGDMLKVDKPVKTYIEMMKNTPSGAYYVSGWKEDLRKLDHYRWVRNQISHKPGYTEDGYCTDADAQWIEDFYARILKQTDPLAMYRRAIATKAKTTEKQAPVKNEENREGFYTVAAEIASVICIFFLLVAIAIMIGKIISLLL